MSLSYEDVVSSLGLLLLLEMRVREWCGHLRGGGCCCCVVQVGVIRSRTEKGDGRLVPVIS